MDVQTSHKQWLACPCHFRADVDFHLTKMNTLPLQVEFQKKNTFLDNQDIPSTETAVYVPLGFQTRLSRCFFQGFLRFAVIQVGICHGMFGRVWFCVQTGCSPDYSFVFDVV